MSRLGKLMYDAREETGDLIFIVESQRIRVDRNVLAASSSVYKCEFFGPNASENHGETTLSNVSASAFSEFIKCFYFQPMDLSKENVEAILKLAVKNEFKMCITECESHLKSYENPKDLCWILRLALKYELISVIKFCDQKIGTNASEVLQSGEFFESDYKVLLRILNNPKLDCNEIEVLNACISWAKASCRRKNIENEDARDWRQEVGDAVLLIRFASMNIHEFLGFYKEHDGFFSAEEFLEISFIIFRDKDYKPKKYNPKPRQTAGNDVCSVSMNSQTLMTVGYTNNESAEAAKNDTPSGSINTHNLISVKSTSNASTSNHTQNKFKIDDFIVHRDDIFHDWPHIWRLASKTRLEKFEMVYHAKRNESNERRNLYEIRKESLKWVPENHHSYILVKVKRINKKKVELIRSELCSATSEAYIRRRMEHYNSTYQFFFEDVKKIISNATTELAPKENVVENENIRDTVDDLVTERKLLLRSYMIQISDDIFNSIEKWPECRFEKEGFSNCHTCNKPGSIRKVILFGNPYHRTTLKPIELTEHQTFIFSMCENCVQHIKLLHELAHWKYCFYRKVLEKWNDGRNIVMIEIVKWLKQQFIHVCHSWAKVDQIDREKKFDYIGQSTTE